ncbi:hypothetical protein [Marinobacter nauticus]|uniref:AraC family transcriptional regulator n=2 Tax=Marinobacter nauticus TaxID=2743 RepID=A1U1M8_MARN8|nr:hypothetical protein [Marinobacter nauticus]ABM18897.1 hypothetical protein Maqu_1815 [Marinobacter nauticus VT8]MBY5936294.1 AraC family transcriptional regulator [Marinobacter nauticus]MBY5953523.1 AraC family transcriptional regulator [Marinobacter nauticus]MBY5962060.1 AraC family transcriptional regulator [Marinobacter nauticus]MBY6007316.1 AraC family transcriptional regulator [Marinobacter nauticus]
MATCLNSRFTALLAALTLALTAPAFAQTNPEEEKDGTAVAEQVEALKKKVIRLNRDLFILEEDLLFPANTQVAVFLSVDTGKFLKLDAVKLKVDDEIVASHLYTERQVTALERGGMQRLYVGNLKTGAHQVTAFVEGIGPDQRPYKQAASLEFEKGTGTAALEIRVEDRSSDYQPSVSIVEWE